jgi:hypothetical protein
MMIAKYNPKMISDLQEWMLEQGIKVTLDKTVMSDDDVIMDVTGDNLMLCMLDLRVRLALEEDIPSRYFENDEGAFAEFTWRNPVRVREEDFI